MSESADRQHERRLRKPKIELSETAAVQLQKPNASGKCSVTTARRRDTSSDIAQRELLISRKPLDKECNATIARKRDTNSDIAQRELLTCRKPLDREPKIELSERDKDRRRPSKDRRSLEWQLFEVVTAVSLLLATGLWWANCKAHRLAAACISVDA